MKHIKYIFILFVVLLLPQAGEAQCAMCRAVLESGENASTAEGINNGIVYLMAIPYILVGGLFYFVYRKIKQ
ncbi:MAG: adrenomedullin/calcitonin family protein [Maribacter sp.]|nr:adrenomedullin/calcitonin family protein [Maribacter sp.]